MFENLCQIIASDNLRDAGAIASVQAAEIYGLNILETGMQVMNMN